MKHDFPIFKTYPDLVYLDSAATSQKPQLVIDAVSRFYTTYNANIHRGIYDLSQSATDLFENTRKKVADFIGAKEASEIIFTAGATEALNYVAFGWAKKCLKKGDIIVLSEMEHHSNIVPWQKLGKDIGIEIIYLPMTKDYRLDYKDFSTRIVHSEKIKLVSLAHASNVLGTVNPVEELIPYFKKLNPEIKFCIDAAQSVPHIPIDVKNSDIDFLAFSSHKMLGPSGVGVLYAKKELLEKMEPFVVGSHMIRTVTKEGTTWADIPDKFEPGTRNLEGVIGLGAAIDYLQKTGFENLQKHESELTNYALKMFASQKKVKLFGSVNANERLGVFSFAVGNVHAHDVSEVLNRSHIAVRAGHHCAIPLMECLKVSGTVRASLYLYNTKEDIDQLEEGIENVKKTFKI
jgi:cysteine desulfurase / selenocysteine lyase